MISSVDSRSRPDVLRDCRRVGRERDKAGGVEASVCGRCESRLEPLQHIGIGSRIGVEQEKKVGALESCRGADIWFGCSGSLGQDQALRGDQRRSILHNQVGR